MCRCVHMIRHLTISILIILCKYCIEKILQNNFFFPSYGKKTIHYLSSWSNEFCPIKMKQKRKSFSSDTFYQKEHLVFYIHSFQKTKTLYHLTNWRKFIEIVQLGTRDASEDPSFRGITELLLFFPSHVILTIYTFIHLIRFYLHLQKMPKVGLTFSTYPFFSQSVQYISCRNL